MKCKLGIRSSVKCNSGQQHWGTRGYTLSVWKKKNRNGNRKEEGEEETKRRNEDKLIYLSVIGVISYIDSTIYM